jgi:hypothetical protein
MVTNQDQHIRADPDLLRQALTRWHRIRDTTGTAIPRPPHPTPRA